MENLQALPQEGETEVRATRECHLHEGVVENKSLPPELEELLNRSAEGLTVEQTQALTALLNEYKDVFATSEDPLGRTSVEKHRIDTGESQPIKQIPRRLPLHLKEKAEEEVDTKCWLKVLLSHLRVLRQPP